MTNNGSHGALPTCVLLASAAEAAHLPQGFSLVGMTNFFGPKDLPAALPFAFTAVWWFEADDASDYEERLLFVAEDETTVHSSETYPFKAAAGGRIAVVTTRPLSILMKPGCWRSFVEHRRRGGSEWRRSSTWWPLQVQPRP